MAAGVEAAAGAAEADSKARLVEIWSAPIKQPTISQPRERSRCDVMQTPSAPAAVSFSIRPAALRNAKPVVALTGPGHDERSALAYPLARRSHGRLMNDKIPGAPRLESGSSSPLIRGFFEAKPRATLPPPPPSRRARRAPAPALGETEPLPKSEVTRSVLAVPVTRSYPPDFFGSASAALRASPAPTPRACVRVPALEPLTPPPPAAQSEPWHCPPDVTAFTRNAERPSRRRIRAWVALGASLLLLAGLATVRSPLVWPGALTW